jgi:thiol-disulfide isomerase/thioredoxin/predicted CopG family antitoxin
MENEKGTKTIKISKDVYNAFLYAKKMDQKESMTKTIDRLFDDFAEFLDSVLISDQDKASSRWIFKIKSKSGRTRIVPTFSKEFEIIRVTRYIYNLLNNYKIHPDESLNMVLFRLVCAYHQNKPVYRVFTSECGNCVCLEGDIKNILDENPIIKENVFVEFVKFDSEKFSDLFKKHYPGMDSYMMPLSILYDQNENEVWYATGLPGYEEVKEALEQMAMKVQLKIDVSQIIPTKSKRTKTKENSSKQVNQECEGTCKIPIDTPVQEEVTVTANKSDKIKILVFSSPSCGPCRGYKANLEKLEKNKKFVETCELNILDVDENADLVRVYGVKNIPTTVISDHEGNKLETIVGSVTAKELQQIINKLISPAA